MPVTRNDHGTDFDHNTANVKLHASLQCQQSILNKISRGNTQYVQLLSL